MTLSEFIHKINVSFVMCTNDDPDIVFGMHAAYKGDVTVHVINSPDKSVMLVAPSKFPKVKP